MPVADPDNDDNRDLTLAPDNDIENEPVDFDPSNFGVIARTNVFQIHALETLTSSLFSHAIHGEW